MITDKMNIPYSSTKNNLNQPNKTSHLAFHCSRLMNYRLNHIFSNSTMIRNAGSREHNIFISQRILELIPIVRIFPCPKTVLVLWASCRFGQCKSLTSYLCAWTMTNTQRIYGWHGWPSQRHSILFVFVFISVRRSFRPFALYAGSSLAEQCYTRK